MSTNPILYLVIPQELADLGSTAARLEAAIAAAEMRSLRDGVAYVVLKREVEVDVRRTSTSVVREVAAEPS